MKKFMTVVCIFAVFGFANAQFQGGLTSEVPNLRVNAMGGVYSLLETSNYADFPQRLLTGQEGAWIGTNRADSWGLVRFNLNNFLALPMPMAWQISAEQNTMVTIDQVFDHVGMDSWVYYVPYSQMGAAYEATNRINSTFAIGLQSNIIAGLGLKMYSNSNAYDETNGDDNNEDSWEHNFWGLETTWGGTMILDDNHFIDASLDLDFWSWDGSWTRTNPDNDLYEEGFSNCDGIMNFGLNGRYYIKGDKVDYAPYMNFNYFSFSASVDEDIAVPPAPADIQSYTFDGSLFNFTLGSGVHYKPAKGVQVYNEFEFRYQSKSQEIGDAYDNWKEESYQSRVTLLPTYRMGVEIVKEIDPKIWWGFNSVQLWGGFNKTFDNVWTGDEYDDLNNDDNDGTDEYTQPTFETVNVTTGAALQNGNFKVEFYTTVNNLYFNDNALNNVFLGLVYMFSE